MKVLTVNFLACAVKTCKASPASFPLHFKDAELQQSEITYNELFLRNVLPRLDWEAVKTTATELGFTSLPQERPDFLSSPIGAGNAGDFDASRGQEILKQLHEMLLETEVSEGSLVCHNCGHEYKIKEGIANFLLPAHLV